MKINKNLIAKAGKATLPVFAGYIVLGIGFGILLKSKGYGIIWALAMSLFIYAGSMQYVMISLITGGASLLTTAMTTLMVNCRHLFYGISMIDKYKKTGKEKIYNIFALTDETYSLLCTGDNYLPESERRGYYFLVSLFDQCYWLAGSVIGSALGAAFKFNTTGIDFSLTALFITIFVEQWLSNKKHMPAITGVVISLVCLLIFGSDNFLIPSMILILTVILVDYTRHNRRKTNLNEPTSADSCTSDSPRDERSGIYE